MDRGLGCCLPLGHVRQLDRVSRELLARAWAAGACPGDAPFTIDLDWFLLLRLGPTRSVMTLAPAKWVSPEGALGVAGQDDFFWRVGAWEVFAGARR